MSRFALVVVLWCVSCSWIVGADKDYGEVFQQFQLSNNYGKEVALSEFDDQPIVVMAFLGTECPLAKLYGPRLNEMAERYKDKGVAVLGINSNRQDSMTELSAYVHRHKIGFPMLKDVGNELADAVEATRTPEVFVFDQARKLRYHGRIDDQYGVGYAKYESDRSDLENAIKALLSGNNVDVAETKAIGCIIGRVKTIEPTGEVTYCKDVAPIIYSRCVSCHRDGEIGPFPLTSYDEIAGWEEMILEVVSENRMPPWNANPAVGHFANDARLTDVEKETLRKWVAGGMPKGDESDLPEPPKFIEGWRIPEPDQVFAMREEPFDVPAQGVVSYKRFVVDPGWDEDKYICAAEARPENRDVVHHILVYIIPPGEKRHSLRHVLVGYAPGSLPVLLNDGVALKVPAHSRLLFEMHYTPNGSPQTDRSFAGVCFMDEADVTNLIEGGIAAENEFVIPAGDDHVEVEAYARIRRDSWLLAMTPHMHLRGKSFKYEAFFPDGTSEALLDVPQYDFNWQLKYILEERKLLPRGTVIKCTAVYDNSEKNLVNPDPTVPVEWGDQSWDEMMIGFFDTLPVKSR